MTQDCKKGDTVGTSQGRGCQTGHEDKDLTSLENWRKPLQWNKTMLGLGRPPRVFCASLADVFDNEVDDAWRTDLWQLIRETPNLRWMLLTKRIGNARKMLPADWTSGAFEHVGLMATLATQEEWDRDWPKLRDTSAPWRGVSCEPLLGPIDIGDARPEWIIAGGESGRGRDTHERHGGLPPSLP